MKWLTAAGKKEALRTLEEEKKAGKVDSRMLPWLRKFNGFHGIVTCSSCQGHRGTEREPYLTFRMNRKRALWFLDSVGNLIATKPGFRMTLLVTAEPPYDSAVHVLLEGEGSTADFLKCLGKILALLDEKGDEKDEEEKLSSGRGHGH